MAPERRPDEQHWPRARALMPPEAWARAADFALSLVLALPLRRTVEIQREAEVACMVTVTGPKDRGPQFHWDFLPYRCTTSTEMAFVFLSSAV